MLDGRLTLGRDNKVFPGACLGLPPQDLKYRGAETEVVIGHGNTLRECVTINRATEEGEVTSIGNGNLLMAYCHLGHNCELGNNIVMSNAIQVAGHVVIEDRAVIGGCLGIHQFVHIGGMAMVGGMTRVDRDVPPYCLVEGHPGRVRGLNRVGLRRRGMAGNHDGAELKQLQEVWTLMYRSDLVIADALQQARNQALLPAAEHFVGSSSLHRSGPTGADACAGPLMVRLLISTGEVSGDLQGSLLIRALRAEAERRGWTWRCWLWVGRAWRRRGLPDRQYCANGGHRPLGGRAVDSSHAAAAGPGGCTAAGGPGWGCADRLRGANVRLGTRLRRQRLAADHVLHRPQEWAWRFGDGSTTRLLDFTDKILAIFPAEAEFMPPAVLMCAGWAIRCWTA